MAAGSVPRIGSLLITGANRGIGLEFVKQLVELSQPPKHIFATCRDPDAAKDLQQLASKHGIVHIVKLDITSPAQYPDLVKTVESKLNGEGLNVIINNAGMLKRDDIASVTRDALMEHFELNAVAPLLLVQAFLPLLKKAAAAGSGFSCSRAAIVNITSKVGSIDDNTSGGIYSYRSSKAALNMITKSLSLDLKPHGIVAAVFHPGWVQTDMGGPKATTTPTNSVAGMLKNLHGLCEEKSGAFLNFNGDIIPW